MEKNIVQSKLNNIGIVWHGHFPWNRGLGTLAKTLRQLNFKVSILTRNLRNDNHISNYNYGNIYRFPKYFQKIKSYLYYQFPVNLLWIISILTTAKKEKLDLLIVRDLPLGLVVGICSKILGIPSIIDMREYYPAFVESAPNKVGFRKITKNKKLSEILESLSIKFFNRIFVVIPEVKNKLIDKGFSAEKIDVFCYFPEKPTIEEKFSRKNVSNSNTVKFVYAGNIDFRRGIDNLIKAFIIVSEKGYHFQLTIVSDQNLHLSILRELVKVNDLSEFVCFTDYFPPQNVVDSLNQFDVGVINHIPTEHTANTLPMKLFEYMASGLAILSSNIQPIKIIIDKENCGVIYDRYNIQDLANKIIYLIINREKIKFFGTNSINAANRQYNWDIEKVKLINALNEI